MDPTKDVTNDAQGNPLSTESKILETGAAAGQVCPTTSNRLLETHYGQIHLEFRPHKQYLRSPKRIPYLCLRALSLRRSEPLLLASERR